MIQFTNVVKQYSNGIKAVDNVSLRIEQGEFVYLVGPSGSGKSTLMKLIYREEKANSGKITVGKYILQDMKEKDVPYLRRYVGVVFQDFKLLPKLNVYENVAYALEVTGKSKKDIKKRVNDVLALVDLRHKIHQYPSELSGGEMQRVAIARAMANRPSILIADEPTGNLDPETANDIFRVLEDINLTGTTIIMGTHNDTLVNRYKHRVVRINDGKIIRDDYKGAYNERD
ncbi:cell division ATP-binding protein FtsE [Fundicoccus culcitae]|uniref:Cell division ATP-binding protein FtsE n=1 Tax=Fundicoccus culcitae TaxID=2969821 RepID=A0ABY5P2U9_9LACT|nr:cell division ATP-binding protein FtsE [Fundicoccus culcitae]UUX32935.1 cell division ATP-binding protein FtsE [Fundicoccus culcitae]